MSIEEAIRQLDQLISTEQAAKRLGFTGWHLRSLVKQGKGPRAYMIGPKRMRFLPSEVDAWMIARSAVISPADKHAA